jgi:hypothetical protein
MLGKLCQALTSQNVNILAFQAFASEKGKSSIHVVVDNHNAAKSILDQQRAEFTENQVAHVTLTHRPGALARAASRLGDAGINIDYGYRGLRRRRMLKCSSSESRMLGRQRRSLSKLPLSARRISTNSVSRRGIDQHSSHPQSRCESVSLSDKRRLR